MPSKISELEIARHQRELILKPHEAHVFGMPMSVPPIANITSGASSQLAQLPSGAWDFGLIDKNDAITLSREMERSDINAIGYASPVRSDFTRDVFGIAMRGLETNRRNIEANLGIDLSAVTPDETTGEVAFDSPAVPNVVQNRYLMLSRIGTGVDMIYFARLFLAGEVVETGEQTITDGEGYLGWPMTVNGSVDTVYGVSVRHYFGGPGWKAKLEEAGFKPLAEYLVTLGAPSAGTFTLTFGGQTTAPIPYNATADDVASALAALNNIRSDQVTVTGSVGGPFTVSLSADLVGTLTGTGTGLTGGTFSVAAL